MSDWMAYLLMFLGGVVAQVAPMLIMDPAARKVVIGWLRRK